MADTTVKDALARSIGCRLGMCDEDELRELDDKLIAIERRRHAREDRTLDQALRELRDADAQDLRRRWLSLDFGEADG